MNTDPSRARREAALALGLPREKVDRAEVDGTLELVALEHLVLDDEPRFALAEVAAESQLDADRILAFWRALGFPDPRPNERIFTASDVRMLAAVAHLIDVGTLDQALALQMARVIGSALNRIAAAEIDAVESQIVGGHAADGPQAEASHREAANAGALLRSAHVVPLMPRILEMVWRRHLATAVRRRIVRATAEEGEDVCVGFADLVGFTSQTLELPDQRLGEVVSRFEAIAYDLVAAHNGRVVKMIGDEVLFMADNVRSGAELALALAAAYRRDQQLSDVRVALACGRVLERDGDVFGAVVNRASRIVHVAFPGSVVVGQDVHDALEHDPRFAFRGLRQHRLKDIGRVSLWSLRSSEIAREPQRGRERQRRTDGGASLLAPFDEELRARHGNDGEAARRLRELEAEAQRVAGAADPAEENTLAEVLHDARLRVEELETQAHQRIEDALLEAERAVRRAGDQARRKVAQVMDAVQRKTDAAKAEILRRTGIKPPGGDVETD